MSTRTRRKQNGVRDLFHVFAGQAAHAVGTPPAFALALLVVVLWAVTGPRFDYSDTWQLVINTGTTIVTFLMVFLIQNTQNRDAAALHLKLDELLCAVRGARTSLVDLEAMSEDELDKLHEEFKRVQKRAAVRTRR
ncbi:MAG TPA: low affinity iron permease family protein [Candidatus Binatia bacterium]|nr:low affinity iron permease family protein [Candidatus Binatia bacterium]